MANTQTGNVRKMRRVAAALIAVGVLLAGCADPFESDMTPEEQFHELLKRPDVEQITKRYGEIQAEIRAALKKQLDLPAWKNQDDGKPSSCGDFPDVSPFDIESYFLDRWITDPISLQDWSEAKRITREIARGYGFESVTLEVDGERDRAYELEDGYGGIIVLHINPEWATFLRGHTGCHLVPEAKKRGRPINEQEKESYRRKPAAAPATEPHTPATPQAQPAAAADPNTPPPEVAQFQVQGESPAAPKPTKPRTDTRRQPPADEEDDFGDINFLR